MEKFIGRKEEINNLINEFKKTKNKSFLVGVEGRRRVGKTRLVDFFVKKIEKTENIFYINLIGNVNLSSRDNLTKVKQKIKILIDKAKNDYLLNFDFKMNDIRNWQDFFWVLKKFIVEINKKNIKPIIFFDEICWFSKKENFINDFANSWNSDLVHENVMVILAGSSTSWMNENIFGNKTVLYNRIDLVIKLKQFTLKEIGIYLRGINPLIKSSDIIQYYTLFGGIISYYKYLDINLDFEKNLKKLFEKNIEQLIIENKILYESLFETRRMHKKIIEILTISKSLTQKEIKDKMKNKKIDDGNLYKDLRELKENGFISIYKDDDNIQIYQINDLFSLFFHYWIDKKKYLDFKESDLNYWKGFAFEVLTLMEMQNLEQIKDKILINKENVKLNHKIKKNKLSSQIDIAIMGNDYFNYLIETKNYKNIWELTSKDIQELEDKRFDLWNEYDGKKQVKIYLITANGSKISNRIIGDLDIIQINFAELLEEMLNS